MFSTFQSKMSRARYTRNTYTLDLLNALSLLRCVMLDSFTKVMICRPLSAATGQADYSDLILDL